MFSVCKFNPDKYTGYEIVYEDIKTIGEAQLLAQLAMCEKQDCELVFIFPGWNNGIDKNKEMYKMALQLAEKYKSE
jgi:hypothetical protein